MSNQSKIFKLDNLANYNNYTLDCRQGTFVVDSIKIKYGDSLFEKIEKSEYSSENKNLDHLGRGYIYATLTKKILFFFKKQKNFTLVTGKSYERKQPIEDSIKDLLSPDPENKNKMKAILTMVSNFQRNGSPQKLRGYDLYFV